MVVSFKHLFLHRDARISVFSIIIFKKKQTCVKTLTNFFFATKSTMVFKIEVFSSLLAVGFFVY